MFCHPMLLGTKMSVANWPIKMFPFELLEFQEYVLAIACIVQPKDFHITGSDDDKAIVSFF